MHVRRSGWCFLLFLAAACARGRPEVGTERPPAAPITVRVDNRHWGDVNILLLHGGQSLRLGLVNASSARSFVLPLHLSAQLRDLQLIADPVGSRRRLTSERIAVRPGTEIAWMLEQNLARSSLSAY